MKNKLIGLLGIGAILVGLSYIFPFVAGATPIEFLVENQGTYTITATTSPAYMTAGTATTTSNVYDTYVNGNASYATSKLAMAVGFVASSTSSTLNWYYEYAQGSNCVNVPTSCDWYADNTGSLATTSPAFNASLGQTYSWTFASSTQGGGAPSGNISRKIFTVSPLTRYVRAVFYMPAGSAAGAVWTQFIGQKQIP